ncbi:hypothetical protein [Caldivirga sp.]|uniref:hypothetical protein n=1 Tax=Caldivirga sp. TaxID=2080243 RepID=UPI003D0C5441
MNIPRNNLTLGLPKGNIRNRIVKAQVSGPYIDYEQADENTHNEVFVIYGGLTFAAFTYDTTLRMYRTN